MSWEFHNLPHKGNIVCQESVLVEGALDIRTEDGWHIYTIDHTTEAGMMRDIAELVRLVRDTGIKMGKKEVRDALGITK